ncbi:terminal nucleotidyltransferase 5D-like [Sycon ciliatum]|uniref:terminal nucleotidyltransferase 5D-like n=1 Tax=Sycon ciliatum TaxID=27933 RepID=UPI0031F6A718|eukprot:scpid58469/ scgid17947/ Protein FAM46D
MTSTLQLLSAEQKIKLDAVLSDRIAIHPDKVYSYPLVHVKPVDLLLALQENLQQRAETISVRDFRLNGSAAAYVVAGTNPDYNDIDMIVNVDLSSSDDLDYLRDALMLSFTTAAEKGGMINLEKKPFVLARTYIRKMIKVDQGGVGDLWSMVALRNAGGCNIEVKFAARLKRQFEFSIDSFQVLLGDYMEFKAANDQDLLLEESPDMYALSVWGDFEEACAHYRDKIIMTDNPEAIFGGGLLKYCRLRCLGYLTAGNRTETQQLERYMCCRFFIDIPRSGRVVDRIRNYMDMHFLNHGEQVRPFLQLLYDTVYRSSQCLMSKDRSEALMAVASLLSQCHQPLVIATAPHQSRVVPGFCPVITHYIQQPARRSSPRLSNRPCMARVARIHTSSPATVAPFA